IGPMGAGKTAVGRVLAGILHYEFYDSDHEVEKQLGADISWIFDLEGESGFRKREAAVIDEFTQKDNIVLATGGGCVITKENRDVLIKRGFVVYLSISLEEQFERVKRSKHRPLLLNDDPLAVLTQLSETREPLYNNTADLVYDTTSQKVPIIAQAIIDSLNEG
ncbi:unnamed protein product, partial [marine sediment metagenome]